MFCQGMGFRWYFWIKLSENKKNDQRKTLRLHLKTQYGGWRQQFLWQRCSLKIIEYTKRRSKGIHFNVENIFERHSQLHSWRSRLQVKQFCLLDIEIRFILLVRWQNDRQPSFRFSFTFKTLKCKWRRNHDRNRCNNSLEVYKWMIVFCNFD